MGSQIFDYWFDPSGFIMEHYVDGDLLDDGFETQRTEASPNNLHVWGEYFPSSLFCQRGVASGFANGFRSRPSSGLFDLMALMKRGSRG